MLVAVLLSCLFSFFKIFYFVHYAIRFFKTVTKAVYSDFAVCTGKDKLRLISVGICIKIDRYRIILTNQIVLRKNESDVAQDVLILLTI